MRMNVETETGHRADLVIEKTPSGSVVVKAVAIWTGIEMPGLVLKVHEGPESWDRAEGYAHRVKAALES